MTFEFSNETEPNLCAKVVNRAPASLGATRNTIPHSGYNSNIFWTSNILSAVINSIP